MADLGGATGAIGWLIATLLTIVALVLSLGSLRKNPALPNPGGTIIIDRTPTSVFAVTRHSMMWGFALWAAAHLIVWWSTRTLVVMLAIGLLALVGAHLQDAKKARLLGAAWAGWEAKNSYWPRWVAALGQAVCPRLGPVAASARIEAGDHLCAYPQRGCAGAGVALGSLT